MVSQEAVAHCTSIEKQILEKGGQIDYLPTILVRTKWFSKVESIKIGDLVMICDGDFSIVTRFAEEDLPRCLLEPME